jgi:hypothetical protein
LADSFTVGAETAGTVCAPAGGGMTQLHMMIGVGGVACGGSSQCPMFEVTNSTVKRT